MVCCVRTFECTDCQLDATAFLVVLTISWDYYRTSELWTTFYLNLISFDVILCESENTFKSLMGQKGTFC